MIGSFLGADSSGNGAANGHFANCLPRAEIIKVEHPTRGDDTRAWGPPFAEYAPNSSKKGPGESAYFLAVRFTICLASDAKNVQNFYTGLPRLLTSAKTYRSTATNTLLLSRSNIHPASRSFTI